MVPWPLSELSYGAVLGVAMGYVLVVLAVALLCALLRSTALRVAPRPISGAHVVITGGSEGIGLAIGLEAAQQGARVTIMARSTAKLAKAAANLKAKRPPELEQSPSMVNSISCDVTNADEVVAAIAQADELAPIDFLICGAGAAYPVRTGSAVSPGCGCRSTHTCSQSFPLTGILSRAEYRHF